MKKILFVIGSLQLGGAETVLVDLINNICNDFQITLLLIEKRGPLLDRLNDNINLKYITKDEEFCSNKFDKLFNKIYLSLIYRFLSKSKLYAKYIYKHLLKDTYNVEIGYLAGVPTDIISNSINNNSKKIAWIHTTVKKEYSKIYNNYLRVVKNYDNLVGVSKSSIDVFEKTFPETKGKINLINNYIDVNKIVKFASEKTTINYEKGKINFVSVGRLNKVKGFDRILTFAKKFENSANFYIVGDGNERIKLEEEIHSKKISNVFLLGQKSNPYPYIKNADAFLLVSRNEAYPTVALEAMILQKDIISCIVPGIEEILKDYNGKILTSNNNKSIEEAINKYIKDKKIFSDNNIDKFYKKNNQNLVEVIKLLND